MRRKARANVKSLKRGRVRQDWSKWTLYNLSRLTIPRTDRRTYFQQKWTAKSLTRSFHGQQVREKKWTRLFSRSIPAVVPMDHRDLAKNDGSDDAAGRGQGADVDEKALTQRISRQRSPYMQMAFHPLERRLDTAIWRALFASSVRQARMMCTQGHVKVNGKPMRHPTYALNPGDMFSITPKKVLWGTGAPQFYLGTPEKAKKIHQKAHQLVGSIRTEVRKASKADEAEAEQAAAEAEADAEEEAAAPEDELAEEERAAKKTLKDLRKQALSMLEEKKKDLSSKQKQLLRALRTEIPKMMSRKQFSAPDLAAAQQRFTDATDLSRSKEDEAAKEPPVSTFTETEIANAASLLKDLRTQIQYLIEHWRRHDVEAKTRYELRKFWVAAGIMLEKTGLTRPDYADAIKKHVASIAEKHKVRMDDLRQWAEMEYRPKEYDLPNPYEPEEGQPAAEDAKPVINTFKGLPWRPRPYMSAFAFIPRYLEVNQNVCSAVYLRHPVVRPGLAEVPTPFPEGLNQLAFNWYLRRR